LGQKVNLSDLLLKKNILKFRIPKSLFNSLQSSVAPSTEAGHATFCANYNVRGETLSNFCIGNLVRAVLNFAARGDTLMQSRAMNRSF
jgi:hypothetical protein